MDVKKYNVSVCIIARPGEDLTECLLSLEGQTYSPMEVVIHREIGPFSNLRNKVIGKAKGDLIVFTDADCKAEKHWLEEINNLFQNPSIGGFYGKVCYELGGKFPTASTRIVTNEGQDKMTANAGFRSNILKEVMFDESINYLEDKILFKNISKKTKVVYLPEAIIFHENSEWSFTSTIKYARKVEDFMKARKKYGVGLDSFWRVLYPKHFLIILFPPILLIFHSVRSMGDLKIICGMYLEKIYTRFLIWKYSFQHKEFWI